MIVKPSPHAPYQVLKAVELAQRYFPAGVVQSVSGGEDVGGWLTGSKEVAKIGFTGSDIVGRKIFERAAADMKRLTLELYDISQSFRLILSFLQDTPGLLYKRSETNG